MITGESMSLYVTLEEAIDAAREEFLEAAQDRVQGDEEPLPDQFNLQKYIMQDGDIMWQAEFLNGEGESTHA